MVVNLQFDTMFRPETLRTRLEEEGKRGWERVEVVMKAGKSIANRGRLVKMGTVQDVHGCVSLVLSHASIKPFPLGALNPSAALHASKLRLAWRWQGLTPSAAAGTL